MTANQKLVKRIEQMLASPKNVRCSEAEALLRAVGAELRNEKGSHMTWGYPGMLPIILPKRTDQLAKYVVERVCTFATQVLEQREAEGEEQP